MPDHFKDTQKIQELLHEAQMGLWVLELNEGKEPRMYACLLYTSKPSVQEIGNCDTAKPPETGCKNPANSIVQIKVPAQFHQPPHPN